MLLSRLNVLQCIQTSRQDMLRSLLQPPKNNAFKLLNYMCKQNSPRYQGKKAVAKTTSVYISAQFYLNFLHGEIRGPTGLRKKKKKKT